MANYKRYLDQTVPLVDKELYDDFLKFYEFVIDTFFGFSLGDNYPMNSLALVENEAMKHKFVGQLKKLEYVEDKKWVMAFVEELVQAVMELVELHDDYLLSEWCQYFILGDETYNTLPGDMLKSFKKKDKAVRKELEKLNEAFEDALLSTLEKVLDPKLHPYPQDYADVTLHNLWNTWLTYSDETGANRYFEIPKRDTIEGKPVVVNTK